MVWRINMFVIFLATATATPWIHYYICALHTIHFILVFLAMWAGAALCSTYNLRMPAKGELRWWFFGLGLIVLLNLILFDVPGVGNGVWAAVGTILGGDFSDQLEYRWRLDHYSSATGLLLAIMLPSLRAIGDANLLSAPSSVMGLIPKLVFAVFAVCFALLYVLGSTAAASPGAIWPIFPQDLDSYVAVHPYIATLPIPVRAVGVQPAHQPPQDSNPHTNPHRIPTPTPTSTGPHRSHQRGPTRRIDSRIPHRASTAS